MTGALLKFAENRFPSQQNETDFNDVLETLADLRFDLQCIEKVIVAIERLAVARMGAEAARHAEPDSRKRRRNASKSKRGLHLVSTRRLLDERADRPGKRIVPLSSVG